MITAKQMTTDLILVEFSETDLNQSYNQCNKSLILIIRFATALSEGEESRFPSSE